MPVPLKCALTHSVINTNIFPPQSVNETSDLLWNYALKFPADAVSPAAAEAAGQWAVKQWTSSLWSVSPAAAAGAAHSSPSMGHWGLHPAARSCAHRTHAGLLAYSYRFIAIWYLVVERNFLWSSFPSRNFHLWFANMGSSCGFSRGNIVVMLLLLLDGKVHHQLYCLRMKLEIMLKRCLSLKKKNVLRLRKDNNNK